LRRSALDFRQLNHLNYRGYLLQLLDSVKYWRDIWRVHSGHNSRTVNRPDTRQIAAVRGFNRFYTRQLGLLSKGFLSSEWSLTEVRVLYELAARRGVTAREVASDLQLDEAYLSRILAKFQRRRLIQRTVSACDARQQSIVLTRAGREAFQPLDQSATRQTAGMLAPLAPPDREALVAAMERVRGLLMLESESPSSLRIRLLQTGDIGWIIHRQAVLYAEEYGWDVTYEVLVAEILAAFVKNFDGKSDEAWIAEWHGSIVGSVFLVRASEQVAKLRLLYVEPSARGLGIGRKLVSLCIEGAQNRGYRKLTLWTNDVLVSARRIYEASGFRLVAEERHRSFGKNLVGQTWELTLSGTPSPTERQ
jgi:DNA-binding MarR family transcriptional regulator/GNAT superfamily N-acetyltransferase